ncbi:hypothetical protein P9112_004763 [Eukaryota sp. TZLM1-RC]
MSASLQPPPELSLVQWEKSYRSLNQYIFNSLDVFKAELSTLLFPYFVHVFTSLIIQNQTEAAHRFLLKFQHLHQPAHSKTLSILSTIHNVQQLNDSTIADRFIHSRHTLIVRDSALQLLLTHLHSHKLQSVLAFLNDHVEVKKVDVLRRLHLFDEYDIPLSWGVELNQEEESDDITKAKKRTFQGRVIPLKKNLADTPGNVPSIEQVLTTTPTTQEETQRNKLDVDNRYPCNSESLPSIMMYSLISEGSCTSMDFMSDGSAVACGFDDSTSIVYDVEALAKLREKKGESESEVVLNHHDYSDAVIRLVGHSSPISDLSFIPRSPERALLTGCLSGDVRYWLCPSPKSVSGVPEALEPSGRNLAVFHCHDFPLYCLKPFQRGSYFVTGSHDKTAKMWSLERQNSVRVFADQLSPVTTLESHPNTCYIAVGSADRFIRVYDVRAATCVSRFPVLGHCEPTSMKFTDNGRLLAIGTEEGGVSIWDVAERRFVGFKQAHTKPVHTLSFSHGSGAILSSAGGDGVLKLWSIDDLGSFPHQIDPTSSQLDEWGLGHLASYPTKYTTYHRIGFSPRNLLMGAGTYDTERARSALKL